MAQALSMPAVPSLAPALRCPSYRATATSHGHSTTECALAKGRLGVARNEAHPATPSSPRTGFSSARFRRPVQPRRSDGSHSSVGSAVARALEHDQLAVGKSLGHLVGAALHSSSWCYSDLVGVQLVSAWSTKFVPAAGRLCSNAPRADSRCIAAACPRIAATGRRRGPRAGAQPILGLGF